VRDPGLIAIAEMVGKPTHKPRPGGQPFRQRTRNVESADGSVERVPVTEEADLPPSEFPTYWTRILDDLMREYHETCAYSCFKIHKVTGARSVDHVAPKSRAWDRVYEWSNYRLVCSLMNARKADFTDVLDPFEIENGWFRLELVGFQLKPAKELPEDRKQEIRDTIGRLGLNDSIFWTSRERDAERYWDGDYSLEVLREESPLVAMELERQERLDQRTRST